MIAEAVRILREYIRIDTSNPPGGEEKAARFLASILEEEGIPYEVYIPSPGRANLLAKLGEGKGAFLLLHHMDVVPAEGEGWTVDPFSGELLDGYIWGRGTLDTKGLGVAQLMAFLLVKRKGIRLKRPLWLLATCDEETGGALGVKWCLDHLEELEEVAFVLNEGGSVILEPDGSVHHYEISTAQKVVAQFGVRARGRSGHGSIPHGDNAAEKLVKALERLTRWQSPMRAIPLVRDYFRNLAEKAHPEHREAFLEVEEALKDPEKAEIFRAHPQYNAMLRNTHTLTVLRAGQKVNVIPSEAEALFDCRLLPDQDPEEFFAQLRRLIGELDVELYPLGPVEPSPPSPLDNPLYRAIERVARRRDPGAIVTPFLICGATDSRFFRSRGIPCYDFSPFRLTQEEMRLVHNRDERLSVENLRFAIEFLYEVILEVAT